MRLLLLVLLGTGGLLAAGSARSYAVARHLLEQEARDKAVYMAESTAGRIEAVVRGVGKVGLGLGREVQTQPPTGEASAQTLLKEILGENQEVYGAAIAAAPGVKGGGLGGKVPYAFRKSGAVALRDLGGSTYRYQEQEWYTRPLALRRSVWSEPYLDVGGGEAPMVTFSVPIFTGESPPRPWGVVTCDVSLTWLDELLRAMPVGRSGYAFLVSAQGTYIVHPRREYVLRRSLFDVAREVPGQDLTELAERMIAGETGFHTLISHVTHRPSRIAYCPVPSPGWSLAVVTSEDEILAPIYALRRQELGAGALGLVLLGLTALLIARSIALPLRHLEAATRVLAAGDLDAPLPPVTGDDEVAHLGRAFARMRDDLKQHLLELQATTAANERIDSELQIARSIQLSLVPKTFPPFPDRDEFEMYALLDAARTIGGDFYDFFMFDESTLCLVIGDVSGKGVPAALFMAVTRTLLRMLWRSDPSPATALARVNAEVARDNPRTMFVSLFCATIDLRHGEMRYASGGHNPPFVIRAGGEVAPVPRVKGTIVGIAEEVTFGEGMLSLHPGDALLLYTDGVTEAMNSTEEFFGTARTAETLAGLAQGAAGESVAGLVTGLRAALADFAGQAEQYDDIAMLGFRYQRPPPPA